MPLNVIRTEELTKIHRKHTTAIQGLNLEVRESEVFGFIGLYGAGKTTTIRLLLDFIRPSSGRVWLFEDRVKAPLHHERLGYLPQTLNFPCYYTGRGLLHYYGRLSGLTKPELDRRIEYLIELLGLQHDARRRISKYSKDAKQRLGLAQALLSDPELLILDEPTSYLGSESLSRFRHLVIDLKRQGRSVFIASGVVSEMGALFDRVALLHFGHLYIVEDLHNWNQVNDLTLGKFLTKVQRMGAREK